MNKMIKFDSIKSRLLLMTFVCVFGMTTLVVSQHIANKTLSSLGQQKDLLHSLSIDLLQLRRHEKDFLLRHNVRYVEQFTQRVKQFATALVKIEPLYSEYELDNTQATELAQTIQRYDKLFKDVVYINRIIGLSSQSGLRYDFAQVILRLEQHAKSNSVRLQLAKMKIAQRDFLLDYDMKSEVDFNEAVSQLSPDDFNASTDDTGTTSTEDLNHLSALFESLSENIQKMGETESEGLRGEFRNQAHLAESRLLSIEEQLEPIIKLQGENVRLYNLLIAIVTCVIMIIILVKSFATFHRSFSYFVMFFYQCKREFQRIDPKKLGFAEFKSLAELANEMVEARKDAEVQLEEAKRQLKEQEGS